MGIMMNSMGSQQLQVSKFDGGNYDFWCVKMKTILLSYDLWDYVEEGFDEVKVPTSLSVAKKQQIKDYRKKGRKSFELDSTRACRHNFSEDHQCYKSKVGFGYF